MTLIRSRVTSHRVALISQVGLTIALVAGLSIWREPSGRAYVGTGLVLLALAVILWLRFGWRPPLVAMDLWLAISGFAAGLGDGGAAVAREGPGAGPEGLALLSTIERLGDAVFYPTILTLFFAGIVGAIAVARDRR